MTYIPSVDDLRLVIAIHRHGSIGAAARELLVSQPSASARLATLERRLGATLFERDTTGARATDAGHAFAREAGHVLAHLAELPERVHAGQAAPLLRVATFPSLAALLFPALDAALHDLTAGTAVHQYIDHGDTLVDLVAEGSLDVAVIAMADQIHLPANVAHTRLGFDELGLLRPPGSLTGADRRPFSGVIPYHCMDMRASTIEQRITDLGGTPRRCATGEVAVLTARSSGQPALLASCIARLYRTPEEDLIPAPSRMRFTLSAVTRTPPPAILNTLVPQLATRMGLTPAGRRDADS